MRTVTLAGWGQPHDALIGVVAGSAAIDYSHASGASEAIRMIAHEARDAERVIGWSLGGQLAVRAIVEGAIAPKQLVLIATPYQFVGDEVMGPETFAKFHASYKLNPKRTLDKAWELIHYEDTRAEFIRDQLELLDRDMVLKKDWLRWLGILEHYDCDVLDLDGFPRTLLVHGMKDKVVSSEQSKCFHSKIKHSKLELWEGCGHAPHLHDMARLQRAIHGHADV